MPNQIQSQSVLVREGEGLVSPGLQGLKSTANRQNTTTALVNQDSQIQDGLQREAERRRNKTMHAGLRNSDVNLRKSERMNNFFRNANRIVMEDDVQNFIRDLVHTKFRMKEREWHLVSSLEGINVYADQRNLKLELSGDFVSRAELKDTLVQVNKQIEASKAQGSGDSSVSSMLKAFILLLVALEAPKWAPLGGFGSQFSIPILLILCALKFYLDNNGSESGNQVRDDALVRTLALKAVPNQYFLKAQFYILGSPDELLTLILNESMRTLWDFDLISATLNAEENKTVLVYNGPGGKRFTETVEFSYMVHEQRFYIVEQANSSSM